MLIFLSSMYLLEENASHFEELCEMWLFTEVTANVVPDFLVSNDMIGRPYYNFICTDANLWTCTQFPVLLLLFRIWGQRVPGRMGNTSFASLVLLVALIKDAGSKG